MNDDDTDPGQDDYQVGYRKPPLHSRFRKGQSGNPNGGRARRIKGSWMLVYNELYRKLNVREGERARTIPAIEAVLRRIIADAAKGVGSAQRNVLELLKYAEAGNEASRAGVGNLRELTDEELTRIILEAKPPENDHGK